MQSIREKNTSLNAEIPYPGGVLPLNRTLIMGVLNVTPDSFSDGGKFSEPEIAIKHAFQMLDDGADIIDIGGESTRPGAEPLPIDTELKRVIPIIQSVIKSRPKAVISIDTYKCTVAEESIKAGAKIVNDISGLGFDPKMKEIVREYNVPIVIMHIKGTPLNMQENPHYEDLMSELIEYFHERVNLALKAGIQKNQIIVDPGIGFGKRLEDNYEILHRLNELVSLDYPVLVGPSRKSFVGKVLNLPPPERIWGTAAAVAIAVNNGANIIRVHDVKEMIQVVRIAEKINNHEVTKTQRE